MLHGDASIGSGYLTFGSKAATSKSYLELPSQIFETGHDFTVAIEYERTSDKNGQNIFSFGSQAYTIGGDGDSFGFRAAIYTGYDRGPTNYLKTVPNNNDQGYCGIVHANGDGKNHLIRMIVRYISAASCLQICTIDTNTDYYCYVNQGCGYPSYNQYTKVKASNMPFSNLNYNTLGSYNGSASYPGGVLLPSGFQGDTHSFHLDMRLPAGNVRHSEDGGILP